MRKRVKQVFTKHFTEALKELLPEFIPIKAGRINKGGKAWAYHQNNLWLIITWIPAPSALDERFTFEIGLSKLGRYPECYSLDFIPSDKDEWLIPIGHLFSDEDFWWNLGEEFNLQTFDPLREPPVEEALARIEPVLADVMAKFTQFVCPVLKEVGNQ